MASNAYENPNQGNGGDNSAGTLSTANGDGSAWSSLAADAYFSNSTVTEARNNGNDKNGGDGKSSQAGEGKGANGADGFSINFGDGFNFGDTFKAGGKDGDTEKNGDQSKENSDGKPESDQDSLDLNGLNELYAMAAASLLGDEGKDEDGKEKDGKDKDDKDASGLDALDTLGLGLAEGFDLDGFGEEEESDTCHLEDEFGNNNEDGDTEQVKSNALNSAAMAAQAAMSGDLNTANGINLNAVYSQLEGEKSEAFANGNGAAAADLSYAQSYVTDAIAKKDHANQISANTTAAGVQTSELTQILAGISAGDSAQSAINRSKPEYLKTA
jgi:hypothetical protein